SNVVICGNIDIDGTKELKANVIMAGIHKVSGTVTIGKVNGAIDGNSGSAGIQYAWGTNATATTNFFVYQDACFIMIDGNGEVSIDGYDPSSFGTGSYSQLPEGTLGVTFIDSDDVFHITNLEKAVAADNDDEITINAIAKKSWIMDEKKFVIDSDFTLHENLEITVINTVLVKDGVTLTRSEGAELISIDGTYGVIEVVGYYHDYNVEDVLYIPTSPSTSYQYVYIKAEVKSIDAAETHYMYTSLENSLTEPADGTIITLFGNVEISKNMTIPENVTVKTGEKYIKVNKEKELTVDGVLIIETGPVYLIYGTDGTDNAKLIVNNMVVGPSKIYKGTTASGTSEYKVAGIYADGTIGDDYTGPFLLNPAVAAANSKTLNNMEVLAKTTYAGSLTFVADEDNTDPTIDIKATATFGKITLDGYGVIVASDNSSSGVLTAEIIAETTSGSASVLVENLSTKKLNISVSEDDSGETTVTKLT
ncbi:hypothetical protein, partial [Candidatus Methanarcanum hacksteinii]|uniref:hypothetical protein n=1 Tax=Candidatus Methanarcanum hacksteinii TaxID=2911857 RepID=UPI0037DC788C